MKASHGVLAAALLAIGMCSVLEPRSDQMLEQFGAETWRCAEMVPHKPASMRLGWAPRHGGVSVIASAANVISFYQLACLPTPDRGVCDSAGGEWGKVDIVVEGIGAPALFSFERTTQGVDDSWRNTAFVSGPLGKSIVSALATGMRARIVVSAQDGHRLYTQAVALDAFDEAMAACRFSSATAARPN